MKNLIIQKSITHILKGFIGIAILIAFFGNGSHASIPSINCETAFGEKIFTISEQNIAFHKEKKGRSISSVMEATTKKTFRGFRKTLYVDGNKHLIHVNNLNNLNANDDF